MATIALGGTSQFTAWNLILLFDDLVVSHRSTLSLQRLSLRPRRHIPRAVLVITPQLPLKMTLKVFSPLVLHCLQTCLWRTSWAVASPPTTRIRLATSSTELCLQTPQVMLSWWSVMVLSWVMDYYLNLFAAWDLLPLFFWCCPNLECLDISIIFLANWRVFTEGSFIIV